MGLINYSDVTGQSLNGATDDEVNLHNGMVLVERVGYAKITPTLQNNIPVFLPSSAQNAQELLNNPDKRLVLPVGAVISHLSFRLPKLETNLITPQAYNLAPGATLIGTTGELVKLAPDATYNTTANPAIASASSLYTPNASAVVNRSIVSPADIAASTIIAVSSATSMSLVVSNAANSAAGTGIRTSTGDALAIVRVCWYEPIQAPTYENLRFLARGRM